MALSSTFLGACVKPDHCEIVESSADLFPRPRKGIRTYPELLCTGCAGSPDVHGAVLERPQCIGFTAKAVAFHSVATSWLRASSSFTVKSSSTSPAIRACDHPRNPDRLCCRGLPEQLGSVLDAAGFSSSDARQRDDPLSASTSTRFPPESAARPPSFSSEAETVSMPLSPRGDGGGSGQALVGQCGELLRMSPSSLAYPPGFLGPPSLNYGNGSVSSSEAWSLSSHVTSRSPGPARTGQLQDQLEYLRRILTSRVYDVAVETPLELAPKLSARIGNQVFLKREDMQPVFSFKLRGAYNMMAHLSPQQLARGVICSSAGNHAQGVALAAARLGCSAVVAMPVTTPEIKWRSVQRLGAEVVLVGDSYDATQTYAKQRAVEEGRVFVPPFDDPLVIAGQGTVGLEILRQFSLPTCQVAPPSGGDAAAVLPGSPISGGTGNRAAGAANGAPSAAAPVSCACPLHAVFVPVGGGGLIAGIAAYVKALRPEVRVIGVEPADANAMALSLCHGHRVELSACGAFADGVAVRVVGEETFRVCRELVDGVVLVSRDAICAAIKDMFEETRSILEPAGALALAGARAYCEFYGLRGENVVAVASGANMNFDRLRLVAELADVGAKREAVVATSMPEAPGAFVEFARQLSPAMNVTEFKYRYSSPQRAQVLFSVGLHQQQELDELLGRLEAAGMPSVDLTDNDLAKDHLRHLVGGTSSLPNELLFRFVFPERPGALMKFLEMLSPRWNITLFHYRRQGEMGANILVGLQVPPEEEAEFLGAATQLGYEFKDERDNAALHLLMH